ncbi:hypothetical protein D9M68_18510 [compost metagenome]
MAKGKYVIPVVMGQPGAELFLVKGNIAVGSRFALVRFESERGITERDTKALEKIYERDSRSTVKPSRVKELSLVDESNANAVSEAEATLVTGYVNNTLPGAFRAPELKDWFIYEKSGDLVPLKFARFAINLLDHSERKALIEAIARKAVPSYNTRYEKYR